MAGIDKTYVNYKQWLEARKFANETREEQIKALGGAIGFYYDSDDASRMGDDFVLWNTSGLQDAWLYQNCKLSFIQNRLASQYGFSDNESKIPELFKLMDFTNPGAYLIQVSSDKINMDLFYTENDDMLVFDETCAIVIYGTTLFLKIINEIKEFLYFRGDKKLNYDLAIQYYGLDLIYKSSEDDWFLRNAENCDKKLSPFSFTKLNLPKINYSFDSSDIFKVVPEAVYFSNETETYHLTDFKEYEKFIDKKKKKVHLNRFNIPDYITDFIK